MGRFELVGDTPFRRSLTPESLQSLMTHAMVFNAFHGEVGNVSRWRVENSWSDKNNKVCHLFTLC